MADLTTFGSLADGNPDTLIDMGDGSYAARFVAQGGSAFTHLAANATTLVKSGAGRLYSVTINTKGATANTLTLYNSLTGSGAVIAVIDTTAQPQPLSYNLPFSIGLTAVIASGTAADITIVYH